LEFNADFLADHAFPSGKIWRERPENRCGVHFECDLG